MSPKFTKAIDVGLAPIFRAVVLGILGLGLCLVALTAIQNSSSLATTLSNLETRVAISLVISVVMMTSELFGVNGHWWKELGTRLIWSVGCAITSVFVSAMVASRTGALQQTKLPTHDREGEKLLIFGGIWLLSLTIAVFIRRFIFRRNRIINSASSPDFSDRSKTKV